MADSVQELVLKAVGTAINALQPFAAVSYGNFLDGNCIVVIPAGGGAEEITLVHGGTYGMDLALNARHTDQKTARNALGLIHESLNKLAVYSTGTNWAIIGIVTQSSPKLIGQEEKYWDYGSSLLVTYTID